MGQVEGPRTLWYNLSMNRSATEDACQPTRRRWTRGEFERAGRLEVFGPEERLELIDGEIVGKMTPQGSGHAVGTQAVEEGLREVFRSGYSIRVQLPLALDETSEPEPDVAVVAGHFRDYRDEHPHTAVLVVEVSDSTLRFDRTAKASLYAQSGIPEYWIVNLTDRSLEVHREPGRMAEQPLGHAYFHVHCHREDETVTPLAMPEARIAVARLLP